MTPPQDWSVRLGAQEWIRFTYPRNAQAGFKLVGSVRRGTAAIGALAVTPEGRYVQVNGDFVSMLNDKQIRRALARAKAGTAHQRRAAASKPRGVAAPVVEVKRRRVLSFT